MPSTLASRSQQILLGGLLAAAASASGLSAEPTSEPTLPRGFIAEAPLPEGFPPPSEPGKIVEKTYPRSRTYSAGGPNAFIKCFSYLSVKRYEMTAPVVLDYPAGVAEGKSPTDGAERMHFVLERPMFDKPGKKLLVEVADVPRTRVVSVAVQADLTAELLTTCETKLRVYVKNRPGLEIAGDLRVLGYNSPSVEAEKRFWEIQLPVETREIE